MFQTIRRCIRRFLLPLRSDETLFQVWQRDYFLRGSVEGVLIRRAEQSDSEVREVLSRIYWDQNGFAGSFKDRVLDVLVGGNKVSPAVRGAFLIQDRKAGEVINRLKANKSLGSTHALASIAQQCPQYRSAIIDEIAERPHIDTSVYLLQCVIHETSRRDYERNGSYSHRDVSWMDSHNADLAVRLQADYYLFGSYRYHAADVPRVLEALLKRDDFLKYEDGESKRVIGVMLKSSQIETLVVEALLDVLEKTDDLHVIQKVQRIFKDREDRAFIDLAARAVTAQEYRMRPEERVRFSNLLSAYASGIFRDVNMFAGGPTASRLMDAFKSVDASGLVGVKRDGTRQTFEGLFQSALDQRNPPELRPIAAMG